MNKASLGTEGSIFIPSGSKITNTLAFILKQVAERQRNIESLHNFEKHPYYYITVDYLAEMIQNTTSLRDDEKTKQVVEQAFEQMLDIYSHGKVKYGYLYPIFFRDDKKIICKVVVIAPQKEPETEIAPLRKNCFEFSLPILDSIIHGRVKKNLEYEGDYPIELVYKKTEKESKLNPYALSLENELLTLIKKAFLPYKYFPQDDFFQDLYEYAKNNEDFIEVNSKYHFIDEELQVSKEGNFLKEPKIYFHFVTLLQAVEKFTLEHLSPLTESLNYTIANNRIKTHIEKFSPIYSDFPENETQRVMSLSEIINFIPIDERMKDHDKELIESAQEAIQILSDIQKLFPNLQERKNKKLLDLFVQDVIDKIISHCKEKKTLFILDLKSTLKSFILKSSEYIYNLEKKLRSEILDSFPVFEAKTLDNQIFYYIGYYPILSAIVSNLAELSFQNSSYLKQYEISKKMYERAFLNGHPDLDKDITFELRKQIEKTNESLEKKIRKRNRQKYLAETYNISAGIFGFFFSVIYFLALYLYFKHKFLLYLNLPISLGVAYVASRIFSERGFRKSDSKQIEESNLKVSNEEIQGIQKVIFQNKIADIESRIFDRLSLLDTILKNLDSLQKSSPTLMNIKNQEELISRLESACLSMMAELPIPKDLLPPKKPKTILLYKEDLRSEEVRKKLIEYFNYRRAAAKSLPSSRKLYEYYNYLYNTIDRDYYKYAK